MSTELCDKVCQKLLLCSGILAAMLRLLSEAQSRWINQGNSLSPAFNVRDLGRRQRMRVLINECFTSIGHPAKQSLNLHDLGMDMLIISKQRGLSDAEIVGCLDKVHQIQTIATANQSDYLSEIGISS